MSTGAAASGTATCGTRHVPSRVGDVAIAIVNWNSGSQLAACLRSLDVADWSHTALHSVIVVDNGSSDDSLHALPAVLGRPVVLVRNAENRGFAAACNQAAYRAPDAGALLFLNPDTRVEPDSIGIAVGCLNEPQHASTAIVGIQLVDEHREITRSCARFPTPATFAAKALGFDRVAPRLWPGYTMNDWDHRESRTVDHVIGAFYLVRQSVFRALGGFDERFFLYFEDLDFSRRASQAGWGATFLAEARAFHKGGGTSERIRSRRVFYSLRSRLLYARKHLSAPAAAVLTGLTLYVEPVIRLMAAFGRRTPATARETIAAYRELWNDREGRRP